MEVGSLPSGPMDTSLAAVRRLLAITVLAAAVLASTVSIAAGATPDPGGSAQGSLRTVEVLPLRAGFLDPPVVAQLIDILEQAEERGSELVVLQLSAPGSVSVDAAELLARIQASSVPVAVLLGPIGTGADAAGAAGLLWLGASVRALAIDASVGPLDPLDLADDRGEARVAELAAAELARIGADPELLDELLAGPVPAERLEQAGAVTLTATGLEPLLVDLDGRTVTTAAGERELVLRGGELEVRFHSLGLLRRILHAATTAPFIYLLLVVGLGMLVFEAFQPGFGVAGLAGLITVAIGGFGLTVLPVTWWAVALVVLGLLLYAVDTAIAGFGPVTLAATVAFATGSARFYASDVLALPWWLIAGTTVTAFVFFVLVMTSVLRAQAGPEGVRVEDLVGRPGIVRSVLNPEGHVYIDGALWRARWTGGTRRAKVGTPVRVHAVDGPVVLVEPFTPDQPPAGEDAAVPDRSEPTG